MDMFSFLTTLAVSTTLIGLLLITCALLFKRLRFWPLYWGAGLVASVVTGILAAVLSHLSLNTPGFPAVAHTFMETLDIGNWPTFNEPNLQDTSEVLWLPDLAKTLVILYMSGLVISVLRLGFGRYRAFKIARNSIPFTSSDGTRLGLTQERLTCMTITPFGRPSRSQIIISESFKHSLSAEELTAVIAHENGHITRRDDEFGFMLRVFVALSWFNPLVHILFDRWTFSAELQCDHIATRNQTHKMRTAYARTLLKALHMTSNPAPQYIAASLSTQHLRSEKMRIKKLMNGSTPTFKHIGHKIGLLTTTMGLSLMTAVAISANAKADPTSQAKADLPQIVETATAQDTHTEAPKIIKAKHVKNSFKLDGELTSSYGEARDPFKKEAWRNHKGVDFKAPLGTPIYAPADAVIIEATNIFNGNPAYGKVVVFQSQDGVQTMMAHLHSYAVQKGQQVLKGQKLAEIGSTGKSTGPHVHIETRVNGARVDPASVWTFE